ncbi:mannose-1-phosphate guanylyltransferase/mannose-6-phosphate isomerase, partial [Sansalvadorimonas verongulae]|uniref:mannose-1-phosphate guanylyltransferase/mannose-6-phosphate isomerase n=1 Tax=Sansalvadorimonas verongulae TaxID=2172824 RepID=UPI0012BC2C3E
ANNQKGQLSRPKQFQPLVDSFTLFQNTVQRLDGLNGVEAPFVVVNGEHRFLAAEQLRQLGYSASSILLEPEGRNTAPAVALAAFQSLTGGDDPLLLVLAADHVIQDVGVFYSAVTGSVDSAEQGSLVTFGVTPSRAETGYGYIKAGSGEGSLPRPVGAFVEKPDHTTAESYVASGEYYWNAGMFLFRASVYLQELKTYRPDIYTACEKAAATQVSDLDFTRIDQKAFLACPSESIDYAVMENTTKAMVTPLDAGWSDIGSWAGLSDVLPADEYNNQIHGDVISLDSNNCMFRSDDKLLACIGLDNLIVVNTDDAVLIADKRRSQDIKQLVERLQQQDRKEALSHRKVFRPWGFYDTVDYGNRFQVKHLVVNPGASLSCQKHYHRAEHWVVVTGTARVTRGEETFLVAENESVFIPAGEIHQLANPGKLPLHLIEIQSGGYLGEDDITRFTEPGGGQ